MWEAPFSSDDPAKGGCPGLPVPLEPGLDNLMSVDDGSAKLERMRPTLVEEEPTRRSRVRPPAAEQDSGGAAGVRR